MFSSFSREGKGIHSGGKATVHIEAGEPGSGIVFVHRLDEIPATPETIASESERATCLTYRGHSIRTVEHLLSALVMVGERDVRVTLVGGDEIPILDGSALPWMESLLDHGATQKVAFVDLGAEVEVKRGKSYGRITPVKRSAAPLYKVRLDFEQLGQLSQEFSFRPGVDSYLTDVAPARTFACLSEIRGLWARGLAKGGDLNSALVLDKSGVVNPGGARFENEPARHKMLDAIGDLSLLGGLPFANISLIRPGHRLLHDLIQAAKSKIERAGAEGEER